MGTLAQKATLTNFGTTATATLSATTAGRVLACIVQAQQTSDISSITDSGGNTWLKAASIFPTSQKHSAIWYCLNAASVTSVVVHTASSANINGEVVEIAGSAGWVLRDANAVANSSSTAPPACLADSRAGDFVVSGLSYLETTSGTRQDSLADGTLLDILARGSTAFSSAYKDSAAAGGDGCAWTLSPTVSSGASTAVFGPFAASAGLDQADIEPFSTISRTGTHSTGTVVSRSWTQIAGPAVTLTGATTDTVGFVAPATLAGTTITLRYAVTDSFGATPTDDVDFVILPHTVWSIEQPGAILHPVNGTRI